MTFSPDQLRRIIEVRYATTTSFVELVQITALDPASAFRDANLRGVAFGTDDLSGFDFSGADLTGADLRGTDLRRVRGLNQAILTDVKTDAATLLPPGLDHAGHASDRSLPAVDIPNLGLARAVRKTKIAAARAEVGSEIERACVLAWRQSVDAWAASKPARAVEAARDAANLAKEGGLLEAEALNIVTDYAAYSAKPAPMRVMLRLEGLAGHMSSSGNFQLHVVQTWLRCLEMIAERDVTRAIVTTRRTLQRLHQKFSVDLRLTAREFLAGEALVALMGLLTTLEATDPLAAAEAALDVVQDCPDHRVRARPSVLDTVQNHALEKVFDIAEQSLKDDPVKAIGTVKRAFRYIPGDDPMRTRAVVYILEKAKTLTQRDPAKGCRELAFVVENCRSSQIKTEALASTITCVNALAKYNVNEAIEAARIAFLHAKPDAAIAQQVAELWANIVNEHGRKDPEQAIRAAIRAIHDGEELGQKALALIIKHLNSATPPTPTDAI